LVFHSSTIAMTHGPINIRFSTTVSALAAEIRCQISVTSSYDFDTHCELQHVTQQIGRWLLQSSAQCLRGAIRRRAGTS